MEGIKQIYTKNLKKLNVETKNIFTLVNPQGDESGDFVIVLESPTTYEEVVGIQVEKKLKHEIEKIISSTGWDKDSSYYTYAVKSCPYEFTKRGKIQYRDVNNDDIDLFRDFLLEEIDFVAPKVVLAIGNGVFRSLTSRDMTASFEEATMLDGQTLILAYSGADEIFKREVVSINKIKDFIFQRDGEGAPNPVLEKMELDFDETATAGAVEKPDYDLVELEGIADATPAVSDYDELVIEEEDETRVEELPEELEKIDLDNLEDIKEEEALEEEVDLDSMEGFEAVELDGVEGFELEPEMVEEEPEEAEELVEEESLEEEVEEEIEEENEVELEKEELKEEEESIEGALAEEDDDDLKPISDIVLEDGFIPVMLLDRGMGSGFFTPPDIDDDVEEEPEVKGDLEDISINIEEVEEEAEEDISEKIEQAIAETEIVEFDESVEEEILGENMSESPELTSSSAEEITEEELKKLGDELNELAAKKAAEMSEYEEELAVNADDRVEVSQVESYSEADKKLIKDVKEVDLDEEVRESAAVAPAGGGIISKVRHIVKKDEHIEDEKDLELEAWEDFNRESQDKSQNKDVLILYAGSELKNDSTHAMMDTIALVFHELNTSVVMMNIHDEDFSIDAFFDALKTSAGMVVGTSVEWYGTGYKLQKFLDDVYYSGRIDLMHQLPTMLLTISRNGYEDIASNYLKNAFEILGAIVTSTVTGVVENSVYYETNKSYQKIVETKAEDFYRQIRKGVQTLPSSLNDRKVFLKVAKNSVEEASDTESKDVKENKVNTYNEFLENQKKDIDELSELFEEKVTVSSSAKKYSEIFANSFTGASKLDKSEICFDIIDANEESFNIIIDKEKLELLDFDDSACDVVIGLSQDVMNDIIKKKVTMQKSFLTGAVKVKGNFALLYKIDSVFKF